MFSNLKNKIIIGFGIIIIIIYSAFQNYKLEICKRDVKEFEKQIRIFERQNNANIKDLIKYIEEKNYADKKVNFLQKKIDNMEKNNNCFDRTFSDDMVKLLQENNIF